MAEIKSAIELAMERTKSLVMDDEEKREFAARDLDERLRATVRRFLEGIIGHEEFRAEYGRARAGKQEKIRRLIDIVAEEFAASAEKERIFDLFEVVGAEAGSGLAEDARAMRQQFLEELEANASNVRKGVMKRLSEMGISGASIEPNIEEWEEWKEAVRQTGRLFERRLLEWKDKVENASA